MEQEQQLDLLATVHKIDKKLTKLYEIVTGDKDFGTEGVLVELKKLNDRVNKVERQRSIFVGILISIGVAFELLRNFVHK